MSDETELQATLVDERIRKAHDDMVSAVEAVVRLHPDVNTTELLAVISNILGKIAAFSAPPGYNGWTSLSRMVVQNFENGIVEQREIAARSH